MCQVSTVSLVVSQKTEWGYIESETDDKYPNNHFYWSIVKVFRVSVSMTQRSLKHLKDSGSKQLVCLEFPATVLLK